MSMLALVAGCTIYIVFADYFSRCDDGPPWFRHLRGQRIFERVLVTVSWRWERSLESRLGTRSLQPQLRWVTVIGFLAALLPLRSEERRVGKECVRMFRSWWSPYLKKKHKEN